MVDALVSPVSPVMRVSIIEDDCLGTPASGCYQEGAAILSWLNEASEDSVTESKKREILSRIIEGKVNAQVRIDFGDDSNTPTEILTLLATDENADVRFALAENQNIHADILNIMLEDNNPFVAHRAKLTLGKLERRRANAKKVVLYIAPANLEPVSAKRQYGGV